MQKKSANIYNLSESALPHTPQRVRQTHFFSCGVETTCQLIFLT